MNLGPHFVVLHKVDAIGSGQAKIHRLNEAAVVLLLTGQHLLSQFVGFQSSLRRELRFLCGLKSHFHRHSLERAMWRVKQSAKRRPLSSKV